MALTRLRFQERTAAQVIGTIMDRDGTTVIPGSALTSATLTHYDWNTGANGFDTSPAVGIINNRNAQNVLNANDVTIYNTLQTDPITGRTYNFIWDVQSEDNIIVTLRRQVERHRAMFFFQWAIGSPAVTGEARVEIEIDVVNLRKAA